MDSKEMMIFMGQQLAADQTKRRTRFSMLNPQAKKGQILFVGSSLTEYFPIEEMQLGLGLDKVIYNRGVAGTVTAELLQYIDLCIFDLAPSKIFINIGTNDIGGGVPHDEFIKNYDEILGQIQTKLPETEVYVMAYYPCNPDDDFGQSPEIHKSLFASRTNAAIDAANIEVEELAKKHDFHFINVNDGLTDAKGNLKKEFSMEGIHLWPNGYEIVIKNLKPYL